MTSNQHKQANNKLPPIHTPNSKSSASSIFEDFLKKDPVFVNKQVLQSNYTPHNIPHREDQINQIAQIIAPALRSNKPSNLFVYGKTGTGKTLSIIHTTQKLLEIAKQKEVSVKVIYINCKLKKVADTEYRLVAQIIREYGENVPATGLPTDEVYKIFYNLLEKKNQLLILILDEIDQLVRKVGDEILYNFTRINSELKHAQVSLIGISNDITFADHLDPRVKSSLSEEELIFPPYNAFQIQDILRHRANQAFKPESIQPGVLEKCAAYAAREHGDARRALELLRVAGEITERKGLNAVDMKHIDEAEEKIEKDRVLDIVLAQPKQFQCTLYAILTVHDNNPETSKKEISTGEVYTFYKQLCEKVGLRPLTQRRVSDVIGELDMLGLINAKVTSKGRYGRTRDIMLSLQDAIIPKIKNLIEKDLDL
jgi:archaeal cell division control protein 6